MERGELITGISFQHGTEDEYISADAWRRIITAIALDMDTMPERLIMACGLSGRTAAGLMSGRYKTVAPYTADRLSMLLVLLPHEGGG